MGPKAWLNLAAVALAALFLAAYARSFVGGVERVDTMGPREASLVRAYALGASVAGAAVAFIAAAAVLSARLREKLTERVLAGAMIVLIGAFVLVPMGAKIAGRMRHGPTHMILDSTLHVEVAADFLIHGKNPYAEDYFRTPLEAWHDGVARPPLYHFVYGPLPVCIAAPFRAALGDAFDFRMLLMAALAAGLVMAWRDWRETGLRPILMFLAFANPWILASVISGRLDVLITLFFVLAMREFRRDRLLVSGFWISLAIATKAPAALLIVPAALAVKSGRLRWLTWALGPAALLALPFLAWNGPAFVEDLVFALAGRGPHPYPIIDAGVYGVSGLPLLMGWVKSAEAFFPFALVQVPATVVLLWLGARAARATPRADVVMIAYAVASAAFFYFGRFSDPAYYGGLVAAVAIGIGYAGQAEARPVESNP